MKRLAAHVVLRAVTVASTLAQSVVLARSLTIKDIGVYYLVATVAYVGSAVVFVGADVDLQRRVADLARLGRWPSQASLWRYAGITSALGLLLVGIASVGFFARLEVAALTPVVIACCMISLTTYSGTLYRNMLLLSGRPLRSSMAQAVDAGGKLVAVVLVAVFMAPTNALDFTVAAATGSAAALMLLMAFGKATAQHTQTAPLAAERWTTTLRRILPVSGSGLLNWVQTQAYRPLLAWLQAPLDIVGTAALLIGLGSTAAMSCFAVIAQMQMPRLYDSRGQQLQPYFRLLALATAGLAVVICPAGWLFLTLTGKLELLPYIGLLVIGVLLEAGNAVIGVEIHRANASGGSLWHLPAAGAAACGATLAGLLLTPPTLRTVWSVAMALLVGQLTAVALVWLPTIRQTIRNHAQ